jgi:hypothetical protein
VAKVRAALAGTARNIESAVKALAGSCTVVEVSAASVRYTNPRNVFAFSVVIPASAYANAETLAQVRAVVAQMKPAYATANVVVTTPFRVGDPASLLDRDALGA